MLFFTSIYTLTLLSPNYAGSECRYFRHFGVIRPGVKRAPFLKENRLDRRYFQNCLNRFLQHDFTDLLRRLEFLQPLAPYTPSHVKSDLKLTVWKYISSHSFS